MGQLKVKKTETKVVVIEFAPCIKCGSDDILFYNCGYSSFNVGGAECRKCKNKVKVNGIDWNAPDSDMIPYWNSENDPMLLKAKYEKQIAAIQAKIDALPATGNTHA